MSEGSTREGGGQAGVALTVALCFAVMVVEGFDIQAMGVAAPQLGPELKMSREVLGEALSASNIGLVFGAMLGGWLADRLGRKPVLIMALLVFGAFTLVTMQARSYEVLFAARLATGLGFGGALPNVMAIAAEVSRPEKRGATAAMMFTGMPVGGCIVALLSWLGGQQDWRTLFLIGGVVPLAMAPLLLFFMRETKAPERQATKLADVLPWGVAIPAGIVFWLALEQLRNVPGGGSVAGIAPWLGGVIGILVAYMVVYRKALFSEGRASASLLLWLVFFPTLLILYLVLNWLPTLVNAKGFAEDASLSAVLFNGGSIVGALVLGPLVDRFGVRWPLVLAFLGLIGALVGLGWATEFVAVMALSAAVGFFLLGANYALYGAAASYYPMEVRGRGSGAAIAWGRLGSVAGPLVGGYLLQGGAAPGEVFYWMTPFALVAAVGVLWLAFATRPQA